MNHSKYPFLGFFIFGILIILGIFFYKSSEKSEKIISQFEFIDENSTTAKLKNFDPNDLSKNEWEALGFTEKQAETILKYKEIVGGNFQSKEQFKKCYAISQEKYTELQPYLLLPEEAQNKQHFYSNHPQSYPTFSKKEITIKKSFNPNSYSQNDWIKLGFTEKQAASILKYKNYLGGSFLSKENLRECFIISDENYKKMEPFILLPNSTPENNAPQMSFKKETTAKVNLENFDPNQLDTNGWITLGFSEKQANVIMNYRDKKLGGHFRNLEEIKACFVISKEKFEELQPFIKLNPSLAVSKNNPVVTASISNANQPKTDFNNLNINEITYDQLLEFGFSKKDAGNLIGFRNNLGGFVNKNQVFETYNIDRQIAENLVGIASINTSTVKKYDLISAPESWLKTHPYFKYSADKILYFRLSNENEQKIWKKMNIKPEYIAKMKLYLK